MPFIRLCIELSSVCVAKSCFLALHMRLYHHQLSLHTWCRHSRILCASLASFRAWHSLLFCRTCIELQVYVTEIAIRLDYKLDESYTPNRLSIRAGTSFHDLREIKIVTLDQVSGWVMIPLEPPDHP